MKAVKKTVFVLLFMAGVSFAEALLGPTTAHAQAFDPGPSVNCDSPQGDLQKAVKNAPWGSTIYVLGSCDDGPYFIEKDVNLHIFDPANPATLSAPGAGNQVLHIRGATVKITGLTIDARGAREGIVLDAANILGVRVVVMNAQVSGLHVAGNSQVTLSDCEIKDNVFGVALRGSSDAMIVGSSLHNNTGTAVDVALSSSAGIHSSAIRFNGIGLIVTKMSSVFLGSENLIEHNSNKGIWVATQYGFLQTGGSSSTVQNNGVDVQCDDRGIFEVEASLNSTTKTAQLAPNLSVSNLGCTILGGPIFNP